MAVTRNTGNPSDGQRDWVNQPTILSNSGGADIFITITSSNTPATIDGFQMIPERNGIQIQNCSGLTIRNTLFQNNYSTYYPVVGMDNSQTVFTNCVFDHNIGSAPVVGQTNASNGMFYNCVFSGNQNYAGDKSIIRNDGSSIGLINCSIVNNSGIGFYVPVPGTGSSAGTATIKNTIFWNNGFNGATEGNDLQPGAQQLNITNCVTQSFYQDGNNTLLVNFNPRFYNIINPAGADQKWFTADDGLQLTAPCSPGLNAGDNPAIAGIPTDLLGRTRIFNGGTVDLGPYELQSTPGTPVTTVYVNNTVATNGDGSSWEKAFNTLQQALLYCADTIKISAGIYPVTNSSTDSIFSIENKKVILGGYPANGNPSDAQRDPARNQTVLKGNYQGSNFLSIQPILQAFHCDATTLIDGLSFDPAITSGSGNTGSLYIGHGSNLRVNNCQFLSANTFSTGGGVLISQNSNPVITASNFFINNSVYSGSSLLCQSNSTPTIRNCRFAASTIYFDQSAGSVDSCIFASQKPNSAGCGVLLSGSNTVFSNSLFRTLGSSIILSNTKNSNPVFNNCSFKDLTGTAVSNDNSSPAFNHCLFDTSSIAVVNTNYAAPVFNNCLSLNSTFMQNTKSTPYVNNCTIINTFGYSYTPSPNETELITNSDSTTLRAVNTIFWGNKLVPGHSDLSNVPPGGPTQASTTTLTNCITRYYGTNGVNGNKVGVNPRFYQLSDPYGPDKLPLTADDGIRLATCSPAVNAGNNSLGTILSTDMIGAARIFGGTVDMGAYELQGAPTTKNQYYVDASATGNNSGQSWQDAFTSLQTAVCNVCSDTLRVAAGVYKAAVSNRDSSFDFQRDFTLLGGYPAGGASDAQRDPFTNATILSGNIGDPGDSTDNSKSIITMEGVPDSVTIDGFTIRDGYANAKGIVLGNAGGAGLDMYKSIAVIRNCQFLNNHGALNGGAILLYYQDSCFISKTVFSNNSAPDFGGAISGTGGMLFLNGCVFIGNHSYGEGGAIQLGGFDLRNCVFYKNYTTAATNAAGTGGALEASLGNGSITNCTFVGNNAAYPDFGGGAIHLSSQGGLGVPIKNCIFYKNSAGGSTTAAQSADLGNAFYNTVFNCLVQLPRAGTLNQVGVDPQFVDLNDPRGKDGKWFTADDGLQLVYGSPAIDYGNNSYITGTPADLATAPRVVGPSVDAGAYEFQDKPAALAGRDSIICSGASVQLGKAGDPAFTYSWTSNPACFVSASPTPVVNPTVAETYTLSVTDGSTTSTDTVRITPKTTIEPTIAVYTDATALCKGASAVFNTIPTFGSDSASFQWQVNGANAGTNSAQFSSSTLADNSTVTVTMTSGISCANPKSVSSTPITLNVSPVVATSATINPPGGPVCVGTNTTLTATPVNGGDNPAYTWHINGVDYPTTAPTISAFIADTSTTLELTIVSSNACAFPSAYIAGITIPASSPATPTVSVMASSSSVCAGDNATFTATPVNGGNAPSYQWLVNGANAGGNTNIFNSNSLNDADWVAVQLTSNSSCISTSGATSNKVLMTVSPLVTPAITISIQTPGPTGTSQTLVSTISNGGPNPQYQWQDSTDASGYKAIPGASVPALEYLPPVTGSQVRCILTSSAECVTQRTSTSTSLAFAATSQPPTVGTSDSGTTIKYFPNPVRSTITLDDLQLSDNWETVEIRGFTGQQRLVSADATGRTQITLDPGGPAQGDLYRLPAQKIGRKQIPEDPEIITRNFGYIY